MDKFKVYLKDLYIDYKEYFDLDEEIYNLLLSMNASELGLMNEKVYKVTPFLKQVVNYALISYYIIADEFDELKKKNGNEDIFDEVEDISTACIMLLTSLKKDECKHPSLLVFNDLAGIDTSYDYLMDNITEMIETDLPSASAIKDLVSTVDNNIIDFYDDMFRTLKDEIKHITDTKTLLEVLKNCSIFRALKKGLISSNNNYYFLSSWVRYIEENDRSLTLDFAKLMSYIDLLFSLDDTTEKYIEDTKKEYVKYKSFQYLYFKDKYKEDKLLENCN